MATYGYSTPYTGRGDTGPLPPGYMEAATAPGRNLAMGIAAMGQNLGRAIEQYRTKKADTEAATQSWETVSGLMQQQLASDPKYIAIQQYTETGQLPPGITEQDIPRYTAQVQADREMLNKFSALGEKFPEMSLAKKKAALGDAVMVLNQYRTNQQQDRAREFTDLQTAAARFNLQTAQDAEARRIREQNILSSAISYAMGQPTTRTEVQQVTEEVPMPPMPPIMPSGAAAAPAGPSQAEATAARYFMGQFGQAAQDLRRYGMGLGSQAAALNVSPTPQVSYPPVFPFPGRPSPTRVESPIEAAARVEANRRAQEQLTAESAAALQQAGIMQRAQPLRTTMPPSAPAAPAAPMEAVPQPPVTVTRNRKVEVPVDYEQRSKDLTQFLIQQGAKPETIAMVPQLMSMIGQQKPIQVESKTLPGGITVVRADGKVDILPAPKMVEGKPLTEAQGKAAAFAAGMKLNNDTINNLFKSGYSPKSLTEVGFMPERFKSDSRKSYEAARDAWIENFLRDRSGAVISPDEYPAAEKQYFPIAGDSEKVVKQKELMRIDAMNNTMKKAGQNADDYVNQISSGQARSPLLSDPRVAVIRARQASGAITKQQAIQQIESLK